MPLNLPDQPNLPEALANRVRADYERFAEGLPDDPRSYFLEAYRIDVAGEYAGRAINCPFGKASGQLSLQANQVKRDAEARLGFCVLKTVIAQDETGSQSMAAWAIKEARMQVERIIGPRTGQAGWTVTWKGRGWWDTFEKYLAFFREASELGDAAGMVIAPSVKYHLPTPDEPGFRTAEYQYTTDALLDVWCEQHPNEPMPLEKDFSPTLAGSDLSRQKDQILVWLRSVPGLIRTHAKAPLTLGIKVMNAMFEDEFQLRMLAAVIDESNPQPDFLVYANRLFNPTKEFEGKVGVAYGGPDLSDRNLSVLASAGGTDFARPVPAISASGDILTGRTAVLYGLRGCTSFQMHTLFQLPDSEFGGTMPNKTSKCLHHLYLHPETGLVPWLLQLQEQYGCADADGVTRVLGLPAYGAL